MKKKEDVQGYLFSCVNYDPCPLCFRCRAYDASYTKCSKCAVDMKKNVCDKKKHTDKALSKMIRRITIRV